MATPAIRRLEIAFDETGAMQGAQATFGDGSSRGLDIGKHPEYATTLAGALGDTTSQLLADNMALLNDKRRLEEEIEKHEQLRGKHEGEITGLKAQLHEQAGMIENADQAFRHTTKQAEELREQARRNDERLNRAHDEVSALTSRLLTKA